MQAKLANCTHAQVAPLRFLACFLCGRSGKRAACWHAARPLCTLLLYVPSTLCDAIALGDQAHMLWLFQQLMFHVTQCSARGAQWRQR